MKLATEDPNFKFKVKSSPYPITAKLLSLKKGTDSAQFVFMQAVGFSVSAAMIIGYLINERTSRLKHMQTMTGLRKDAYWVGNFVMDFIKLIPPMFVVTALPKFMGYNQYDGSWLPFLVFPFGILPYLYCMSFIIQDVSAGQTFMMFYLFFIGTVFPGMVFVLRLNGTLYQVGDILNWIGRTIPSFAIANSVFCDANCPNLSLFRSALGKGRPVSPDPMNFENAPSDAIMILVAGAFWTITLIIIENGMADKIAELYDKSISSRFPKQIENLDADEDVKIEENRVRRKRDD